MAEFTWKSPLADVIADAAGGADRETPPLEIREVRRALYSIVPRRGRTADVSAALSAQFGATLPEPGHAASAEAVTVLWTGLDTWTLAGPAGAPGPGLPAVRDALDGLAAVADQSDGRCLLRLTGVPARPVLAKLCPVDLHPRVFGPGRCAATRMAHVSALLLQLDDTPSFEIHVFRAFAESFLEKLLAACAEFGYRTRPLAESRP